MDSTNGRILRTYLMTRDTQVSAEITVTYRADPGVDLLVPAEMREQYLVTQSSVRIAGSATYSRFRRFTVVTTEKPKND